MRDQEIIASLRSDNPNRALLALYGHFPMMRKMVRRHGGNTQDAEDLFQEALLILCRRVREDDFTLTAQLSTYLFSICRFLWKDELRKRKNVATHNFDVGLPAHETLLLGNMLQKEADIKLAEQVITELGDRCRELLLLFYNSRLKLKDIAARMGYNTENTAKNQKYKCLENAKNRLKTLQQTISTH